MKKITYYPFLLFYSFLFCDVKNDIDRGCVEVKGGYFFFSDKELLNIYSNGGAAVSLSGCYSLITWKERYSLDLYTSASYFSRSGYSMNGQQKTSIWQIPVDVGIRTRCMFSSSWQSYLGVGPTFFYIHQHNDSEYVPRNQGKGGIGFFINTGICYKPHPSILFDIFGEYFYGETHFQGKEPLYYSQRIQTGGFLFGAGLGYAF